MGIGERDLKDMLGTVDFIEENRDYIRIGDKYLRLIFIQDYPRYLSRRVVEALFNFPGGLYHSIIVRPQSVREAMERIRSRRMFLRTIRALRHGKGMVEDYGLEKGVEGVEEDIRELQRGETFPAEVLWVIGVSALDPEELEQKCKKIDEIFARSGITGIVAVYRQLKAFESLLPQGYNALGEFRNVWKDSVAGLYPFGEWGLFEMGLPVGINRIGGEWVILDDWKDQNPNMVIVGEQRSGKSVYLKVKIAFAVARGDIDVYVIDPEGEYRKICDFLGGVYLDMGLKSEHRINIMDINSQSPEGFTEMVNNVLSFLEICCGGLSPQERNLVINSTVAIMEKAGIYKDYRETWEKTPPVLADLYAQILAEGTSLARELAARFQQYATGIYSEAFNCHTSMPDSPFMVFGVNNVPRNLRPLRIFQILSCIWSRTTKGRKTLVIVDEAWDWLSVPGASGGLEEIARRFPKRGGGLQLATQHGGDLARTKSAEVIRDTAAHFLLFHQKPQAAQNLRGVIPLREELLNELPSLSPGEGILISRGKIIPVYVVIPPFLREIVSTTPGEW
ncbi:MAG: hypothetical protein QW687_02310 [Candidatus Hadarchaeales archaeon]